jgi:hypothetical protein
VYCHFILPTHSFLSFAIIPTWNFLAMCTIILQWLDCISQNHFLYSPWEKTREGRIVLLDATHLYCRCYPIVRPTRWIFKVQHIFAGLPILKMYMFGCYLLVLLAN